MIEIDGSYGEGGGQILRTSLSLAAITGLAIRIINIRALRPKPGLAPQHLTSVWAAARICQAQIHGDALGSIILEFIPTTPVQAGNYTFDVREAQPNGSAGAIALVLQTIILPLILASGNSQIILRGGTHVIFSPTMFYIEQVYVPMLRRMGVEVKVQLNAWGWYPQGGGEVQIEIKGNGELSGIDLLERGDLQGIQGLAVVTELPAHIPQRMANRAENLLRKAGLKVYIQTLREKGVAPGAGIFLIAEYENSLSGFSGLGKLRLTSEKVAEIVCGDLLKFHHTGAPVDEHLADQLLLPMALAGSESQYHVARLSRHLITNAAVIEQFGLAQVRIDEAEKRVLVRPSIFG